MSARGSTSSATVDYTGGMKPPLRPLLLAWLLPIAGQAAGVELSPATTFAEADLVDIERLAPAIALEMRYAGAHNFVGEPIEGYESAKCYLKQPAAAALARAEQKLRARGYRLRVFDCYRPARAVRHFVRWAEDLQDQRTKAAFYPNLDKSQLLGEYIAPVSGHSRGATVDITLMKCERDRCQELDMGTPFDFFDVRAHTDFASVSREQRANRDRLREALGKQGFENYPAEWWHFTFKPEPTSTTIYDIPIR